MLDREINDYFESKGYNIDELRSGDGTTLEELNYGNDITNTFVNDFENGKYEYCRDIEQQETKFSNEEWKDDKRCQIKMEKCCITRLHEVKTRKL